MTDSTGFIKIPRAVLDMPIWQDARDCALYLYCLLHASHNQFSDLQPGQFHTGKLTIADDLNWGRNTVKRHLQELEDIGLIHTVANYSGATITILHWNQMQQSYDGLQQTTDGPQQSKSGPQQITMWSTMDHNQEYNQKTKKEKSKREVAFEEWWSSYPRHERRSDALKLWLKMKDVSPERLTNALCQAKCSQQWTVEGGKYIPSAAKFLDGKWQDFDHEPVVENEGGRKEWKTY